VRLRRQDLHLLTGVYALDAVDGPERDRFERHLAGCRSCANEVRGLAATAAQLGLAVAEPAPADLRSRVLAAATVTRQVPPDSAEVPPRGSTGGAPWVSRLAVAVAALCLVIAVAFGAIALSAQQRLAADQAQDRAIAAVLAAPDAQVVIQRTTRGGTATAVVSRDEGKVVVTTRGLPALPVSKVYQLWFIGPPGVRSAGLVPAPSGGRTAPVLASGLRSGDVIGMTVEPAGGTSHPTTTPILLMSLPA
jgi:anti-sigma-K factor RskA